MTGGFEAIKQEVPFEIRTIREGVVKYVFKHVEVGFDTSGKNYKLLPEIGFSTFDDFPTEDSLSQPERRRSGVDMQYIANCIETAMRHAGYNEVWLYPYGDDGEATATDITQGKTDQVIKDERSDARLRLFRRFGNIVPEPSGFGYILKI